MKYNQNFKIMQITDKTLVIGVDIAKKIHYARAFDWRGIELDRTISFKANSTGFSEFMEWAKKTAEKNGKDKIIVGNEPTGHYWYTFAQALLVEGIMVVQVNPYHVKKAKELDDNSPSKSDRKDPKTIAMLVKDGRYQIPYIPTGKYAELRKANNLREEWLKKMWSIKNKMQRWLDTYFPEFLKVFSDWEGKAAIMTLERMCLPSKIVGHTAEEIVSIWREEIKRAVGIKRAQKLIAIANSSVGIKEGLKMAEYEMQLLLKEYLEVRKILDELEKHLEDIVLNIPGAERLLEVKGIGIKTVAGFLAEIGDITRFSHPKQIIKLAGLNLRENSSGKHKGETKITKRGRSRLRGILFRAILPLAAKNQEFNTLHKYYTTKKENPLKKKQSLIALCNKLIRIAYTLITMDVAYDPAKMMEDIHRNEILKAA
ncbi:Transposase [Geosporobacter subterraneus DSM 17957]|uniref:Transposase n=3 Tax=Geosporobacter subterraneus DSM 17957 TaxID=1121919 RepID=A0A1M6QSL3_9FIRM|nr:IS110 family transposase [Geosporobacter subterraneus]SHK23204.1 Transposase [Geosporobacter subterraneus DSM 17957]